MALPTYSAELCFNPEVFLSPQFSVEEFVAAHRHQVKEEELRDDLLKYYQTLKNAMVELINKDYADFVDLSSNLIGIDNQIEGLSVPLTQLLSEIKFIKSSLHTTISELEQKLSLKADFRRNKTTLQHFISAQECLECLETIMCFDGGHERNTLSAYDMDRVSMMFNKLQYNVATITDLPAAQNLQPRIAVITEHFQTSLEQWFMTSLHKRDEGELLHCLQIYALIGHVEAVEVLFSTAIVQPYMDKVVSPKNLLTHPQGLGGVFHEILSFITKQYILLDTTSKLNTHQDSRHFDFLVHSVWPAIVKVVETKASIIFAPGNPDNFYKNYTVTMEFISQFEHHCQTRSRVKWLRSQSTYKNFLNKWSLPVYFQLRFQEIAGNLETRLAPAHPLNEASEGSHYQLLVFKELSSCLHRCWSVGVFLSALAHRFWKLTIQLITRAAIWLKDDVFKEESRDQLSVVSCIKVVGDVEQIIEEVELVISRLVEERIGASNTLAQGSLHDATDLLQSQLEPASSIIVEQLVNQSVKPLETAHSVPRLYWRTNRAIPSKPLGYVKQILQPLSLVNSSTVASNHKQSWQGRATEIITNKYHDIINDVLISVKRTEDSLQKLKRSRRSTPVDSSVSPSLAPDPSGVMSDDNKIRLQLALDITSYVEQVRQLFNTGVDPDWLTRLAELGSVAMRAAHSLL